MKKSIYLAFAAIAMLTASPALAGGNSNNNGPTNSSPTTIENKPTTNVNPTFNNNPRADATSTLGSLNKFGGDGGTGIGTGIAAADANSASLSAALAGAASKAAADAAASASQNQTALSSVAGSGNSVVDVKGNNAAQKTDVNVDASTTYQRNPVATATAFGASGGGGKCPRFGPAVGVQSISFGASVALPVFKDIDCTTLAYAEAIFNYAGPEAAIQYLSKKNKDVNESVTLSRRK